MKNKIIAVQEGLHKVAALLREEGYNVVSIDDNHHLIDIIVYSNTNQKYLAHDREESINLPSNNQFVKMINLDEVGFDNLLSNLEEID